MNKRQKQIAYRLSSLLLLVTLISCNHHPVIPELSLAEKLLEDKPDSALIILQQIHSPDSLPDKDYAYYCLFRTLANDKNYVVHTSDSTIKTAIAYFGKHKDKKYGTLAYYAMGRVYTDLEDAPQAQECYLKALELGENSENHRLLVKINNNLGSLYSYQNIFDMALPLYKKALQYSFQETTKDSLNISFILRNIARAYSRTQELDSAIFYFKEATKYSLPVNVSSILVDLGNTYYEKKDIAEAKKCIDKAEHSTSNRQTLLPIYLSKGRLLIENGQLDSAGYYLKQSAQSQNIFTKSSSLEHLVQIALKEKNYKDYVRYNEEYKQLGEEITTRSHFENLRITQSMFNYQQVAKEKNKYEKKASERMILVYQIFILSVLILILFTFFFRKEQAKKKRLLEIKEQQYKRSQRYIEDNKSKIAKLEEELSSKQIQQDEVARQLLEAQKAMLEIENIQFFQKQGIIQILEKDFHNTNLYIKIHGDEDVQLKTSEWIELRYLIDSTYPDFTKRLIREYNKITEEEIRICYLVKMNVPVKKIASMMHISSSGVSQCRRRLYTKFTNEPGSAENFDRFIADF